MSTVARPRLPLKPVNVISRADGRLPAGDALAGGRADFKFAPGAPAPNSLKLIVKAGRFLPFVEVPSPTPVLGRLPLTAAPVTAAEPSPAPLMTPEAALADEAAVLAAVDASESLPVIGPSMTSAPPPAPRPARVVLPPAAVATELAVQRQQEAAAAAARAAPPTDGDTSASLTFRCAAPCCAAPYSRLPADAVARLVACTDGCVLRYHAGACAHCDLLSVAWALDGAGSPCPTPDCAGVTLYAAEMAGGAIKAFRYGEEAKATREEAERQRRRAAKAKAKDAAAAQAAAKQPKGKKGGKKGPAVAVTAAAEEATAPSSAPELSRRVPAQAAPPSPPRDMGPPVRVLKPRTPSPPAGGAHRGRRRAAPPPLAQAWLRAASEDDSLSSESAAASLRTASEGSASEDDELIDLAGRYASSCASEAGSSSREGGSPLGFPLSLPPFLAAAGADAESAAAKNRTFWADVASAAAACAAARAWAPAAAIAVPIPLPLPLPLQPTAAAFVPMAAQEAQDMALAARMQAAFDAEAQAVPAARATVEVVPPAPSALRSGVVAPATHPLHKTVLCKLWLSAGCCGREQCSFAHGLSELRDAPTPTLRRCRYFDSPQGCRYGADCRFLHL